MTKHVVAERTPIRPSPAPARRGVLLRKCACGRSGHGEEECAECQQKREGNLQRAAVDQAPADEVPPIVHDVLREPGQPLDAATRAFMEPRFGHDFSGVRVHTGASSEKSAEAMGAAAYTVGPRIVFGERRYDPHSYAKRWLLAHELAHVVQQDTEEIVPDDGFRVGASTGIEQEATGTASSVLRGNASRAVRASAPRRAMLLKAEEFRAKLGSTKEQQSAITALFANATFRSLWDYMRTCPAKPKQDLGPLALKVTPGLKMAGVERYGGYFGLTRTLEINPTKPEHTANPTELVDTIVHELIHAADDLQADCKSAGGKEAPLGGAATVSPPSRAAIAGTPEEARLMTELGPGASNPCEEFLDINRTAQQMVVGILRSNIKVAKVGRPTVTFVNEILRRDRKAMAAYEKCRVDACKASDAEARRKAVGVCSADIIATFMPADLAP